MKRKPSLKRFLTKEDRNPILPGDPRYATARYEEVTFSDWKKEMKRRNK